MIKSTALHSTDTFSDVQLTKLGFSNDALVSALRNHAADWAEVRRRACLSRDAALIMTRCAM
jgi:hypothetical protein